MRGRYRNASEVMRDALRSGVRACVPPEEDRARIVGLMCDYVHRHPEARGQDSVMGLGQVLERHFPCRGE